MAFLMLYGAGWTQRWAIPPGTEALVEAEISRVGHSGSGKLGVLDPGSSEPTTLYVAWSQVAAAVIVDSESTSADGATGQYA